ncbi:N-acetyltransferase [Chryseotalea sanaruensis]|uniref:N-acetyltransferase n=1 Tax=Chryseotalea sanaruensis TaxID=2482724 RepID=A0A401UD56_9BACT|nr:GNAT family N-acetyltransferase [Chryseotalea sanaruensis]GCC52800.1 N-acetyltransferase [Chryseotalea sanaruensis]
MITKLNSNNKETAYEIRSLFQASYRIEAALLNVSDFPPLNRELVDFLNSDTEFYGLFRDDKMVAIVEVKSLEGKTDIESLVVHPEYFRQGLGKRLMQFILKTFDSEIFTVETGLKNKPATELYKQLGFYEQQQWDTEFGIRKVKFIRTKDNTM